MLPARNVFSTTVLSPSTRDDSERRRFGRVRPELLGCNLGAIADLSSGGIRLRTRRALRGRRRVVLRREGDDGLLLLAAVRWSRRVGFRKHEVGLSFLDPSDEDASILKGLALGS